MARPTLRPPGDPPVAPRNDDAAVRAAVIAMPASLSHAQVSARLRRQFGADRAWPAGMVRDFVLAHGATGLRGKAGERGRIEQNPQLRAFVDRRIGRGPLNDLLAMVHARFGSAALSRSGLHRYLQRERARLAEAGSPAR
jgi:hypothetical protein